MARAIDPVMKELRGTILLMGSRAEAILEKSIRSARERSRELATQVAEDDVEIDRLDVSVDGQVLHALALQAPVAADLREVVAIKMIASDVERVGDLARNIAKSAARLADHPEVAFPPALEILARSAQDMLRRSLNAFSEGDSRAAQGVLDDDDELDEVEDDVVRAELEEMSVRPLNTSQAVDFIMIAKHLERVGDHATNIAEDVILIAEARNVKHASKLG